MDLTSVEDGRKFEDDSDVWHLGNWMNNDVIGQNKSIGGETVDLWEANDLYLSNVGF